MHLQCKEPWCLSQTEGFCKSGQKHGALTFPGTTLPLSQGQWLAASAFSQQAWQFPDFTALLLV